MRDGRGKGDSREKGGRLKVQERNGGKEGEGGIGGKRRNFERWRGKGKGNRK